MATALNTNLPRYVGYQYAIYERVLVSLVLSDTFRYERFLTKDLAIDAIADRGDANKKYVLIEEYSIVM